jgi:hypothetical protein
MLRARAACATRIFAPSTARRTFDVKTPRGGRRRRRRIVEDQRRRSRS